ncbi:MAG TPA: LUD domain-containing protein [Rhizomicrobium sp.]|nr:LUD domain-containing protein [Rhizomicrobium sp.]
MSARDDILSAIRERKLRSAPKPSLYRAPVQHDLVADFARHAQFAHAEVRVLKSEADVPAAIADLLRSKNLPAVIHLPPNAPELAWSSAPGLSLERAPPGPEDAALAIAPVAIAETGTVVFPSRTDAPASWHFRAGFEIAIVRAENIVPHMEVALARLKREGNLPSTVNFVTGPSRTGDIEQTLELGAHGPKNLAILVVREGA